jgi:hypothetical protein
VTLPFGFGNVDMGDWLRGIAAAVISGGAGAVTASFVASSFTKDIAVGSAHFFELVITVFAVNGTLGFFAFLAKDPLPDIIKTVTTTIQVTEPAKQSGAVLVTTVAETHVEPLVVPTKIEVSK